MDRINFEPKQYITRTELARNYVYLRKQPENYQPIIVG